MIIIGAGIVILLIAVAVIVLLAIDNDANESRKFASTLTTIAEVDVELAKDHTKRQREALEIRKQQIIAQESEGADAID